MGEATFIFVIIYNEDQEEVLQRVLLLGFGGL